MQDSIPSVAAEPGRIPEARYTYYRRCRVFRRNGEQCKAPAEKGSYICHAHAGQLALAVRRERERRAVLAEAVAEMRRKGRPEFEMADLFMDFKGIQVTLAKMAQALIDGRIDCKTAGRLVVQLQTASKLLRMAEKAKRQLAAEALRRRADATEQYTADASISPAPAAESRENSLVRHGDMTYSRGPSTRSHSAAARDRSILLRITGVFGVGPKYTFPGVRALANCRAGPAVAFAELQAA
jgi:hypothetical protein